MMLEWFISFIFDVKKSEVLRLEKMKIVVRSQNGTNDLSVPRGMKTKTKKTNKIDAQIDT